MSQETFDTLAGKFGEKLAGLRMLEAMGLPVAPYRVLAIQAFQQARPWLQSNACAELPQHLAAALVQTYTELTERTGLPLVLVRGSLAVKAQPCGRTLSDMADTPLAAVEVARRIYASFLEMTPAPEPDEAVAIIMQVPSFQLADLHAGDILTGILATQGQHMVVEACGGAELVRAPKWWNGASAGLVSWSLDIDLGQPESGAAHSRNWAAGAVSAIPGRMHSLSELELTRIVTVAQTAKLKLGADVCIEWVRAGGLCFHQLRPAHHAFLAAGRRAALGRLGQSPRWTSAVAVGSGNVLGRLCLPGLMSQAQWPAQQDVPLLWVGSTRKDELPVDAANMHSLFAGIVDPNIGSRLSHIAARLTVPCVAIPGFDAAGVDWTVHGGGLRLSQDVWSLSLDTNDAHACEAAPAAGNT